MNYQVSAGNRNELIHYCEQEVESVFCKDFNFAGLSFYVTVVDFFTFYFPFLSEVIFLFVTIFTLYQLCQEKDQSYFKNNYLLALVFPVISIFLFSFLLLNSHFVPFFDCLGYFELFIFYLFNFILLFCYSCFWINLSVLVYRYFHNVFSSMAFLILFYILVELILSYFEGMFSFRVWNIVSFLLYFILSIISFYLRKKVKKI